MAEGNKGPLVSLEEFRSHFANASKYHTECKTWPESTILLYKYTSDANYKNTDNPANTWKRLDHEQKIKSSYADQLITHSELIMIERLREIHEYQRIHSIEVIQSYSPCSDCSDKLCKFKEALDERKNIGSNGVPTDTVKEEATEFKITFSNFYNPDKKEMQEGLKKLLKSRIKLDIFTEDSWKYFFNITGLVTEKRQRREMDDKKILQYFEGLVSLETITEYLEARNLGLPNTK